jgi:hypothetical protein
VLTVNGKAVAVVHDAAGCQRLLDAIDRAGALEGIRRGLASMKRDEGRPLQEALEDIGRKYEGAETRKVGVGRDAARGRRSARGRGRDADRDTMRAEYAFSKGERGVTAARYVQGTNVIVIDPDVLDVFPDGASVNETLRALARVIRQRQGRRHKLMRQAPGGAGRR